MRDLHDQLINFGFRDLSVTGRIIRLHDSLHDIKVRYPYHQAIQELISSTILLSHLLVANFKFEGVFKLQIESTNGIIKNILCDARLDGTFRIYVTLNHNVVVDGLSFQQIVGTDAKMIFHVDAFVGQQYSPYQSVIMLDKASFQECILDWFNQSEQLLTDIKFIIDNDTNLAFAVLLQSLPNDDIDQKHDDFNTVKLLTNTLTTVEAHNDSLVEILLKLYNQFSVVQYTTTKIANYCGCSWQSTYDKLSNIILQEKQLSGGDLIIQCMFCEKEYIF